MFPVNRFEIQLISHIEVGTNRFGVTVHHDRLVATFFDGEQTMNTAVVELDTLTNAVGATAENNNFFTLRWNGFVVEDRICHCGANVRLCEKF